MIPEPLSPLANHLWQSTLFAGVAGLLTLALRKNPARVRHWVWVVASLKFLVPFSVLISLGSQIHWRAAAPTQTNLSIAFDQVSQSFTAPAVSPLLATGSSAASPLPLILGTVWAIGFIGIACAWSIRWRRITSAVRAGSPVQLDLPIRAISSPSFLEPGVFGIFRPALMLPDSIFEHLTPEQWKSVVAHELCHVRHRDNLIGAVQMFIETVFWFHPLVWWIGKRIFEERERACDEEVLRLGNEPRIYAQGILKVCEVYMESPLECVAGVSGSDLRRRIEAIMSGRAVSKVGNVKKLLLTGTGLMAVMTPIAIGIMGAPTRARAQANAPSRGFEVVSIRPVDPADPTEGFRMPQLDRGVMHLERFPLTLMIQNALRVRPFEITGLPAWVATARYDIQAKSGEPATAQEMWPMLVPVLEERFKMKMHREMQEKPVYELSVSKAGKLTTLPDAKCFDPRGPMPPPVRVALGQRPLLPCDSTLPLFGRPAKLWGTKVRMPTLVSALKDLLRRPVVDKSGFMGTFDVELTFERDETVLPGVPSELTAPSGAPSIFTALQEQLGLKLKSAKDPVEVIVVDSIEQPSEN